MKLLTGIQDARILVGMAGVHGEAAKELAMLECDSDREAPRIAATALALRPVARAAQTRQTTVPRAATEVGMDGETAKDIAAWGGKRGFVT